MWNSFSIKVLKSESQKLLSKQDQEESFSLMPDPPKNVREKVRYTSKFDNLFSYNVITAANLRDKLFGTEGRVQNP